MSEFFTQSELAERLVQKTGIGLETAKKFSFCFFSIVKKGLRTNDRFSVYNFGTFKKTWIETTTGFNPSTGEKMEISAHWRIKFIPCPALARRLNRPYETLTSRVINEKVSDSGLLSRASKIRSEEERDSIPQHFAAIGRTGEHQDGFNFDDNDFEDDSPNDGKGFLKYIIAIAVSALVLIVLLALLFKSCVSSSKKTSVREEKSVPPVNALHILEGENPDSHSGDDAHNAQEKEKAASESGEDGFVGGENGRGSIATEDGRNGDSKDDKREGETSRKLFEFYTVPSGLCYHRIAEEKLGNRHLWTLLYSVNKSMYVDPDLISANERIRIPDLNGKSAHDYAKTDAGRAAIFAATLDSYNGYLLMIEKQPGSRKNDERRRRAVGAIVSGEIMCPGFIDEKSTRIMPEYASLARTIVERQYK